MKIAHRIAQFLSTSEPHISVVNAIVALLCHTELRRCTLWSLPVHLTSVCLLAFWRRRVNDVVRIKFLQRNVESRVNLIEVYRWFLSGQCKCPSYYELHRYTVSTYGRKRSRNSPAADNCYVFQWDRNPLKVPLPVQDVDPLLTRAFFGQIRVFTKNSISIGSSVFAQLTVVSYTSQLITKTDDQFNT